MTASNTADLFYGLFNTFTFLAILVGGIVLGLMAYLVVRFRGRDSFPEPADAPTLGHIPPSRGHLKTVAISVTLSAIVVGVLIFGTLNATNVITTIPAECLPQPSSLYGDCAYIQVTAFRFGWNFTYLNTSLKGQTLTGNLTIPFGTIVVLKIRSMDPGGRQGVFHAFGIDDYKIKKDAIPGLPLPNILWFRPTDLNPHTIRCFEYCGIGHPGMTGRVNVVQPGSLGCSSAGC